MVRKLICCSFEKGSVGGFMTICNGIRADAPGHFSKTVAISRESFLAACKNRHEFSKILGVDITMGWQNSLGEAIKPFMGMKEPSAEDTAKFVIQANIEQRGIDAVQSDMEKMDADAKDIVDDTNNYIKEATGQGEANGKDRGTTEKPANRTGKGGKKSRGKTADGAPDGTGQSSTVQSGPANI